MFVAFINLDVCWRKEIKKKWEVLFLIYFVIIHTKAEPAHQLSILSKWPTG